MATPSGKKPAQRDRKQQDRLGELEIRLAEAEETLRAIREGEVDAVIVSGTKGEQVFSLTGTDSIYRLIVETMKEAAFTVTFDGTILFCNAQFGRLVQRPPEQVVGRPLREFVVADSRAEAASLLAGARQRPVRQRLVFEDSGGRAVPAHVAANLLDEPGGPSICVVASDLTELENSTELIQRLRRQQEALQASNEELNASRAELERARARFQDLFETAPDGYVVTDPEGTIQDLNKEAARLLARPGADLRRSPLSALAPAADREGYFRIIAALSAGEAPLPKWDVELRPPGVPRFWASVTAAAARDEEGRILGLRWLIRDISDRKRAEENLRKATAELERSNKDLAGFAYVASHDLQDPLRAVTGFLGLLQDKYRGQLDHQAQEFIGHAREGASRMSTLINDLLEYGRVSSAGRSPAPVDLTVVVDHVRDSLGAAIEEADAVITVDPLPTVMADPPQMSQLFQNLIGNALKFRVEGRRPEIHIGARSEPGRWVIQVRDNGIGIPQDQHARIFVIFQRLHGRQAYPGTGIGLAICQKIVERHGGRLWVESAPGVGSTFSFSLPLEAG